VARNILIMGNCQTGGLWSSLAAMLPGDRIDATMWLGVEPPDLAEKLDGVDVLVTTAEREVAQELVTRHGSHAEVVVVPSLLFFGLHPDLAQFPLTTGDELIGVAGPYHSKIVVWGYLHGHDVERIVADFTTERFAALGYLDCWSTYVRWMRGLFEPTDVDFATWYLAVVRRGAFMLTNNHPRLDAIVELARAVARRLGADERLVAYDWTQVLPDGLLATAPVWPVYPGVAESLDLPGAFVWRLDDGNLLDLERFVDLSLTAYRAVDPDTIVRSPLDVDRFARVLGTGAPAAGAAPAATSADAGPADVTAAPTGGR